MNEYAKFRITCKACKKGKHEKCSDSQKTKSSIGKNEICICAEQAHRVENPK